MIPFLLVVLAAAPAEETIASKDDRARIAYDAGDFAGCQSQYESLGAAPEWSRPGNALYSAACCAARAGKPDAAFALLNRMLTLATAKEARGALDDTDLETLKKDARWPAFVRGLAALEKKYAATPALQKVLDADQADRQGATFSKDVIERDAQHRAEVSKLISKGMAKTAADYRAAALVFQHGQTVEEIARAHELAKKAMALEASCVSKHMVAMTEDRLLMRQALPQKYGTQFVSDPTKTPVTWKQYQLDPSVTDEQRVALCVPPLAEQHP